jgi:hypothetical protein
MLTRDKMIEDGNEILIGMVISILMYILYISTIDKLIQSYKIDIWTMFIIYFVPFILLYIETPILLKKYSSQKNVNLRIRRR